MKTEFEKYLREEFCGVLNKAQCQHLADKAEEMHLAQTQELRDMLREFIQTDEAACLELKGMGVQPPPESYELQNKAKKVLLKFVDTNKD